MCLRLKTYIFTRSRPRTSSHKKESDVRFSSAANLDSSGLHMRISCRCAGLQAFAQDCLRTHVDRVETWGQRGQDEPHLNVLSDYGWLNGESREPMQPWSSIQLFTALQPLALARSKGRTTGGCSEALEPGCYKLEWAICREAHGGGKSLSERLCSLTSLVGSSIDVSFCEPARRTVFFNRWRSGRAAAANC